MELYQQKHCQLGGKEKCDRIKTENLCYLLRTRKKYPKGNSEIMRAVSPIIGPECTGWGERVEPPNGFQMAVSLPSKAANAGPLQRAM